MTSDTHVVLVPAIGAAVPFVDLVQSTTIRSAAGIGTGAGVLGTRSESDGHRQHHSDPLHQALNSGEVSPS